MSYEGKEHAATDKSHDEIEVSSLLNSRKTARSKFTRIKNKLTTLLDSDLPSRHEVKLLVHELKETETKLEEICEKIQIALTSLGDTDRLEQLEVWLDKLVEEALSTKTEAAQCLNDSNSSVSSKGSFQREMKKMGQGARLKEPMKGLDHGNTPLGPHRMFASRPFEADLHLESDKAGQSKLSSYREMRTENPRRKNVVIG